MEANRSLQLFNVLARSVKTTRSSPVLSAKRRIKTAARRDNASVFHDVGGAVYARSRAIAAADVGVKLAMAALRLQEMLVCWSIV